HGEAHLRLGTRIELEADYAAQLAVDLHRARELAAHRVVVRRRRAQAQHHALALLQRALGDLGELAAVGRVLGMKGDRNEAGAAGLLQHHDPVADPADQLALDAEPARAEFLGATRLRELATGLVARTPRRQVGDCADLVLGGAHAP